MAKPNSGRKSDGKSPKQTVKRAGQRGRSAKANTPSGGNRQRDRTRSNGPGRGGRGGGRGGGGRRGGGRNRRPRRESQKTPTAEELDRGMDDYWIKNADTETASKKLDEDMDSYWEQRDQLKKKSADDGDAGDAGEATAAATTTAAADDVEDETQGEAKEESEAAAGESEAATGDAEATAADAVEASG